MVLEVRHHDLLGIGVRLGAGLAHLLGGPDPEQLVAARRRLELQFLVMGELRLEGGLGGGQCGNLRVDGAFVLLLDVDGDELGRRELVVELEVDLQAVPAVVAGGGPVGGAEAGAEPPLSVSRALRRDLATRCGSGRGWTRRATASGAAPRTALSNRAPW